MSVKRCLFFLTLLSIAIGSQAQDTASSSAGKNTVEGESVFLFYGKKLFHESYFDQLGCVDPLNINGPLNMLGFGRVGQFTANRSYTFSGHFVFLFAVPQTITIDSSKTARISGWMFSCSPIGFNAFPKSKHVSLIFSAGVNAGRLKLRDENKLRKKNPYLSPMISIAPKLRIGKLTTSLLMTYDVDFGRGSWNPLVVRGANDFNPSPFRQDGFTASIGFSYMLNYVQTPDTGK